MSPTLRSRAAGRFEIFGRSLIARLAAFGLATVGLLIPLPVAASDPWLFVNDIHLDAHSPFHGIVSWGVDTNPDLFVSTLREMKRLSPNPPVIVIAGDFLAHHLRSGEAVPTMKKVALAFGRTFPHAQFVVALGNEDSACGDYAITDNAPFLRAAAKAWAPLVNRNGAAPDFVRTFAHDGFYTARLPIAGVRAVIVDDVFWSTFYHNGCGAHGDPTPGAFDELERALRPAGNERFWLIMHIPPGVDASSTVRLIHHLAIVPFLRPVPRDAVLAIIADPARRVELVVTGHVHRFAFRIVERKDAPPVPMLISPAVSPILGNLPSFLTADVGADGVVRNIEEHSYVYNHWQDIGGIGTLGASEFTGPALVNLEHRLGRDANLRAKYWALYMGDSRYHEINDRNWRSYWCAATEFGSTAFRDCVSEGGFSFLTRRGVIVVGIAIAGIVLVAAGVATFVLRRMRRTPAPHERAGDAPSH